MPSNAVALIPARAGSKGIPGKNTRFLDGKPLIAHAIECAIRTGIFSRILVSTDSEEIAAVGRKFGAETPFLRPRDLAADDTPMLAVIQHALLALQGERCCPAVVTLLQPTSPFRRDVDIVEALHILEHTPQADSVVSVEEIPAHFSPQYAMKIEDGRLSSFLAAGEKITRRQDVSPAYSRNGQFYMTRRTTLLEKGSIYGKWTIPFVTRHKAVNLDTLDDWDEAEHLAAKTRLSNRET